MPHLPPVFARHSLPRFFIISVLRGIDKGAQRTHLPFLQFFLQNTCILLLGLLLYLSDLN